jgi:NDP-sugar pyrophosphorylase family protein
MKCVVLAQKEEFEECEISRKPIIEIEIAFKPCLQYTFEQVQRSNFIDECVFVVDRTSIQFAKSLCKKMMMNSHSENERSSASLQRKVVNTSGQQNSGNNKAVKFEFVEVDCKSDVEALRHGLDFWIGRMNYDDEDVCVISARTIFDIPIDELVLTHVKTNASLTALLSERRIWDGIDVKYGRAPKLARYVSLMDFDDDSNKNSNGRDIKRLVMSSSESDKTVKINRSALDFGNVKSSVKYREVRVYVFNAKMLTETLQNNLKAKSMKNDIVPEMCQAQFLISGNLNKPVVAVICKSTENNFACEIEKASPHFLEISREILNFTSLVGREPSARHENFVSPNAELGSKSVIGSFCAVSSDVIIGEKVLVKRSVICEGAFVGQGSKITNSVIMSNARIEDGCQISNSVIGANASVGKNSTLKECVVECECEVTEEENVREECIKRA